MWFRVLLALALPLAGLCASPVGRAVPEIVGQSARSQAVPDPYASLKVLGGTPVRASRDIAASPVSIGFETLDRCTFDPAPHYRLLGETGVKWARCSTGWMRCERADGTFDFAWLDAVVDGLRAEGIQPWFQLGWGHPAYTPCKKFREECARAASGGPRVTSWGRGYVGESPLYWGEKAMSGWRRYVRALAQHFKGRVSVFEVWNEPEAFWRFDGQRANALYGVARAAADFALFVHETGKVVKGEIPDARIGWNLAVLSSGWVPALASAGVAEDTDIVMYHGYQPYPEAALDSMLGQFNSLFRRKDGTVPAVWQGESGRATGPANNAVCLPTPYSQARFIARRIATDLAHGVELTSVFTAADFQCYYPDGRDQFYGIVDGRTLKPKHGYYTLQCMSWLADGLRLAPEYAVYFTTSRSREFTDTVPFAAVKTAAFTRKGVPVIAAWQPQHVELNAAPVLGALKFVLGAKAGSLRHPVLIDPVRCRVLDASTLVPTAETAKADRAAKRDFDLGIDVVAPFCALDYPLFLTDAAVFDL